MYMYILFACMHIEYIMWSASVYFSGVLWAVLLHCLLWLAQTLFMTVTFLSPQAHMHTR